MVTRIHELDNLSQLSLAKIPQSSTGTPVFLGAGFQFAYIHPFLDGNGRTSRLPSTLCLYRAGYDFKRLFTISEYYDWNRPAFYKAIQSVRESGMDLTAWLEYFVEGLATQLAEVRRRGERAIDGMSSSRHQSLVTTARHSSHDRTGDRGRRSNESDGPRQTIRVQ